MTAKTHIFLMTHYHSEIALDLWQAVCGSTLAQAASSPLGIYLGFKKRVTSLDSTWEVAGHLEREYEEGKGKAYVNATFPSISFFI